jgi:hypothetical protein
VSGIEATQHITEQLRCNACQELRTASLPEEVLADGHANQQYGYSARSLMAIHKCLVEYLIITRVIWPIFGSVINFV